MFDWFSCSGIMFKKNSSVNLRLFNYWLIFVLFLSVISQIPNYYTHYMSWVNCSLFFLIFLQCIVILRKEVNNKGIFINLAAFSLVYSLCFINSFFGKGSLIENSTLANYIYQFRMLLHTFLLSLFVLYVCVSFFLKNKSLFQLYTVTLLLLIPVFFWCFGSYIFDFNYIYDFSIQKFDYSQFDQSHLQYIFYPFFFICIYGILLYKKEKSLGEYINSLMVCFFVLILLDIVDFFSTVYQIKIYSLSQYVLFTVLLLFILTLYKKINFVYSEFGQFYERLVMDGNKWGIPIKRKRSDWGSTFLSGVSHHFNVRRNTFIFLLLLLVFSLNYLEVSLFLKLNITAITFAVIVLFFYISALHQKRISSGNYLSSKNNG